MTTQQAFWNFNGKDMYPVNLIEKNWPGPEFGIFAIFRNDSNRDLICKHYGKLPDRILTVAKELDCLSDLYYVWCNSSKDLAEAKQMYNKWPSITVC